MKTSELIKEVKDKVGMPQLLHDHGVAINNKNQALCVFHKESNPSMAVYPSKVKCFHEGTVEDVIAVYMELNHLGQDQFKQAVTELYDRYITNIDKVKPYVRPEAIEQASPKTSRQNKKPKRINNLEQANIDFIPYEKLNDFDQARINEYFRQRGIPCAVADIKECGYDIGLDKFFKIEGYMSNLMYKLNDFYIKRGLYSDFKGNAGTSQVTKLHKYKGSKDWVVVEGITDALTILELNRENGMEYNVICLNSTSNANKFIKSVEPEQVKKNGFKFYILLDQDEAGEQATEKLLFYFAGKGIKHELMTLLHGTEYKDINSLIADERKKELDARYRAVGIS